MMMMRERERRKGPKNERKIQLFQGIVEIYMHSLSHTHTHINK